MARGCLAAIGIAMALFSAFFVITAAVELVTGTWGDAGPGVIAGLLVFFAGILAAGLFLTWQMLRRRPATAGMGRPGFPGAPGAPGAPGGPPWAGPPSEADRERQVLRFAETEHGRVTIPEVATQCNMTIADAKVALDRLVMLEVATIQVTQNGVLVYVFPGFLSDDDKARAQNF